MTVKLLFDENISYKICRRVSDLFPNSQHINALELERAQDIQIWEFARRESFTIVTQDSDFNDLAILKNFPPHIIWLRTGNVRVSEIEQVLRQNYSRIVEIIETGRQGVIEINNILLTE
jgi:predicted nuclease of predicted toxin-antitoxin system